MTSHLDFGQSSFDGPESSTESTGTSIASQRTSSISQLRAGSIQSSITSLTSSDATSLNPLTDDCDTQDVSVDTVSLPMNPSITVSFSKGSQMFKLRYTQIDVHRDSDASLRSISLVDIADVYSSFVHHFPNTRYPIPHIEHPFVGRISHPIVLSFLEDQTVTTAQVLFSTQPHYLFNTWEDCVHFQEAVFHQHLDYIGGVSEIKSKGRGEECISQNVRILRKESGQRSLIYFANSQRRECKRYVSIPLDGVKEVTTKKSKSLGVTLQLHNSSPALAQLRNLHLEFLDNNDKNAFWNIFHR